MTSETTIRNDRREEIRNDPSKRLIGEMKFDQGTLFDDIETIIDTVNGTDSDLAAELGPGNNVVFIIEIFDGGVVDKDCACGARLTGPEDVEFGTEHAPAPGAREPASAQQHIPVAKCSECGASVGAIFGLDSVLRLYSVADVSLPNTDD